jgi:hypothetical protein
MPGFRVALSYGPSIRQSTNAPAFSLRGVETLNSPLICALMAQSKYFERLRNYERRVSLSRVFLKIYFQLDRLMIVFADRDRLAF